METVITIEDTEESPKDVSVATLKGALGGIPLLGELLAEITSGAIPNQRVDRIGKFLRILDIKLQEMGEDIETLKEKMTDEGF